MSHSFTIDDWEPDELSNLDGRRAYFWTVPANVHGTWKLSFPGGDTPEVTFDQRYQKIEGYVRLGTLQGGLREARLSGPNIAYAYVDNARVRRAFSGTVNGATMEGTLHADNGAEARWTATKR